MSAADALVIATRAELESLPQSVSLGRPPRRIRLALPGLGEPERSQAEARLATLLGACGCNEGALALIAALGPAVAVGWGLRVSPGGWQSWALFFGVLVLASLLGKLIGLHRAKGRLREEIGNVLRLAGQTHSFS